MKGEKLTKAQKEVLLEAHKAMRDGGIWFRRSSLVVAMRMKDRGLLSCLRRHPEHKMFLFRITRAGRAALRSQGGSDGK